MTTVTDCSSLQVCSMDANLTGVWGMSVAVDYGTSSLVVVSDRKNEGCQLFPALTCFSQNGAFSQLSKTTEMTAPYGHNDKTVRWRDHDSSFLHRQNSYQT